VYGRRREVGRVRQLMRGAIAQMALPHLARLADASRVEAKRWTWMTSARIACLYRSFAGSAALPSLLHSSQSYWPRCTRRNSIEPHRRLSESIGEEPQ
jgi:hypothetical protein